ncbi:hypothetical protein WJX72_005488 [[Myrmecia] bisecta]|uniref:Uncharacterized protein n=1 Tax=[Myrmecia] bisecta TaxID=41462 RepID=A0AAW1P3R7_9CHLO
MEGRGMHWVLSGQVLANQIAPPVASQPVDDHPVDSTDSFAAELQLQAQELSSAPTADGSPEEAAGASGNRAATDDDHMPASTNDAEESDEEQLDNIEMHGPPPASTDGDAAVDVFCTMLQMMYEEGDLSGRNFSGFGEFLFRKPALRNLTTFIVEMKTEKTFSDGICQLLAQLMSALEDNLDRDCYDDTSNGVSVAGVLTSLSRFLFVRLTATVAEDDKYKMVDVRMEHSKLLELFAPDLCTPHSDQSSQVMQLLCTLLLPEACHWGKQEWDAALQASLERFQGQAEKAVARNVLVLQGQLAQKDEEIKELRAQKKEELAQKDKKIKALEEQLAAQLAAKMQVSSTNTTNKA